MHEVRSQKPEFRSWESAAPAGSFGYLRARPDLDPRSAVPEAVTEDCDGLMVLGLKF